MQTKYLFSRKKHAMYTIKWKKTSFKWLLSDGKHVLLSVANFTLRLVVNGKSERRKLYEKCIF